MSNLRLLEQLEDNGAPVVCDNCDWQGVAQELDDIADAQERLTPGDEVPAGQCPECGALAYLSKEEKPRKVYVVQGVHWSVPNTHLHLFGDREKANAKARELVNTLLIDAGLTSCGEWQNDLLMVQEWSKFNYERPPDVWIEERELDEQPPPIPALRNFKVTLTGYVVATFEITVPARDEWHAVELAEKASKGARLWVLDDGKIIRGEHIDVINNKDEELVT
jgi:hypothetical protein